VVHAYFHRRAWKLVGPGTYLACTILLWVSGICTDSSHEAVSRSLGKQSAVFTLITSDNLPWFGAKLFDSTKKVCGWFVALQSQRVFGSN
jgi:hypothetical protein